MLLKLEKFTFLTLRLNNTELMTIKNKTLIKMEV